MTVRRSSRSQDIAVTDLGLADTLKVDDLFRRPYPDAKTLFGPSGCGKSTLLRCSAGREKPDTGEIEIAGVTVSSSVRGTFVPPNRRRIGMVFQSYAIWPHMTVLENVTFPLEAQRKPKARERVRAALDIVGLAALEGRYASLLSGGQQQRVAFARAIVAEGRHENARLCRRIHQEDPRVGKAPVDHQGIYDAGADQRGRLIDGRTTRAD
jgi:ABC-type transporter Mla maintaining outer membrane lipid asymmetry ATPase subunit MlaF